MWSTIASVRLTSSEIIPFIRPACSPSLSAPQCFSKWTQHFVWRRSASSPTLVELQIAVVQNETNLHRMALVAVALYYCTVLLPMALQIAYLLHLCFWSRTSCRFIALILHFVRPGVQYHCFWPTNWAVRVQWTYFCSVMSAVRVQIYCTRPGHSAGEMDAAVTMNGTVRSSARRLRPT